MPQPTYRELFDRQIQALFHKGLRLAWPRPSRIWRFLRWGYWQRRALHLRRSWEKRGLHVPPVLIASVTHRCNLNCQGCYARYMPRAEGKALTVDDYARLFQEASELGLSIVILAGGEPLLRPELISLMPRFRRMLFCLFTNGTLLDEAMIRRFQPQPHLLPVLSLEGHAEDTDRRRGAGIYQHLILTMTKLNQAGLFWGISLTVHRNNFTAVLDPAFIQELIQRGCRLFFFIEYVPIQPGTHHWVLNAEELQQLYRSIDRFNAAWPGFFIAVPGDETAFEGCLSAGRGFIHLSPEGRIEPCPFSPFADSDVHQQSLHDALQSEFLKRLRQQHHRLSETQGGCALWTNRDWVAAMLQPGDTPPPAQE